MLTVLVAGLPLVTVWHASVMETGSIDRHVTDCVRLQQGRHSVAAHGGVHCHISAVGRDFGVTHVGLDLNNALQC